MSEMMKDCNSATVAAAAAATNDHRTYTLFVFSSSNV